MLGAIDSVQTDCYNRHRELKLHPNTKKMVSNCQINKKKCPQCKIIYSQQRFWKACLRSHIVHEPKTTLPSLQRQNNGLEQKPGVHSTSVHPVDHKVLNHPLERRMKVNMLVTRTKKNPKKQKCRKDISKDVGLFWFWDVWNQWDTSSTITG